MTPADDRGWWVSALYAVIGLLWAAAVSAYGLLARTLASKEYVKDQIVAERDRVQGMIGPLIAEIATMKGEQAERHRQNQVKLDRILERLR